MSLQQQEFPSLWCVHSETDTETETDTMPAVANVIGVSVQCERLHTITYKPVLSVSVSVSVSVNTPFMLSAIGVSIQGSKM